MKIDSYGQQIFTEQDLIDFFYKNPDLTLKNTLVEKEITFSDELSLKNIPNLIQYHTRTDSLENFDKDLQSSWLMPDEYQNMDIAKWILDQCSNDAELQRAGQELLMFHERGMFPLLKYLKYLVDTMRKHNVVWGVGRGSSVASFVLFLLGVHKINSLFYDLDINEFLK